MKSELLANHVCAIPMLSLWYRSEWEPYYGDGGPGDAEADLRSRCNHHKIPIGLLAVEGDDIHGIVALDTDLATNLTPSVVGLLVHEDQRAKGVATHLLGAAECLASQLNYDQLYISTAVLGALLKRRGWQPFGEVTFLNRSEGAIFKLDL